MGYYGKSLALGVLVFIILVIVAGQIDDKETKKEMGIAAGILFVVWCFSGWYYVKNYDRFNVKGT